MNNRQRWAQIPIELRRRPQWCYTYPGDADASRRKAPRKKGNALASDTSPSDWMTFEQACAYAEQVGGEIGYVLTEDDEFTCIDLDVKDATTHPSNPEVWTTQEDFDRYWRICQTFDSYTELSTSGKGLHIWVIGKIGPGCKRDGVEVYSQERFIICTGNVVLNRPIREHQQLLDMMVADMRAAQAARHRKVELVEEEEEYTDAEIIERAMSASNAEKFNALCRCTSSYVEGGVKVHGSYTELGYPSQSEADLALMSIFAFYSKSNEQCKRLFRMTGLGKRDKATKNDRYLNDTLRTIRSRQAAEAQVEASAISLAADTLLRVQAEKKAREATLLHVPGTAEPARTLPPPAASVAAIGPQVAPAPDDGLPWPPGLAGQIAYYIYQSAPRPVKEVAIVSALGFLAGVCGKAFCIPQSGLNLYIVLIAKSAIGKEAMHSGISSLITAAASRQPPVMRFVDFSDFASGPALRKAVVANPSFVNVAGEWGHKLKRLAAEDGRDTPMTQLRQVMTDLYQKSGPMSIVGGITYSNKDSNIASVAGVAYSMIGESTPGRFYESLTESMMEDGFLSRFIIVEYTGERPPLNVNPLREPSKALGDAVADLCTHAMTLLDRQDTVMVSRTEAAAIIMEKFEKECDAQINGTQDEMWRQMWNRASLKMMRVSALLAVADNWLNPIIDVHHVEWALTLIRKDIAIMSKRIEAGDIGMNDDARERKIVKMLKDYLEGPVPASYGIPEGLRENSIVPRKFLQIRTARQVAFTSHRAGSNVALDHTLRSMCDSGYIMEVDRAKMVEKFNFHGKAYRILHLPNYRPS